MLKLFHAVLYTREIHTCLMPVETCIIRRIQSIMKKHRKINSTLKKGGGEIKLCYLLLLVNSLSIMRLPCKLCSYVLFYSTTISHKSHNTKTMTLLSCS